MSEQHPTVTFGNQRLPERFWDKVMPITDGCWIWIASTDRRGYGKASPGSGRSGFIRAHRMAFEALVDRIPEGLHVLHRCDVPECVNPDHLFLGTNIDNIMDMRIKGRCRLNMRTGVCRRGHNMSEPGLYIQHRNGRRRCRMCENAYQRMKYSKRSEPNPVSEFRDAVREECK